MKSKPIIVFLVMLFLVIAAAFVYLYVSEKNSVAKISTFDDCVQNGFPVQQTEPPRCTLPDGRFFTKIAEQNLPDNGTGNSSSTDQFPPGTGTTTASTTATTNPNIMVASFSAGDTVTSPLVVTGQARGNWFFEASFPVQLVNSAGKVLASAPAQAQDDWMTNNFVPFTVTLTFSNKVPQTGKLILKKDNPSGLPQNEAQIEIPVILAVTN